jgi:23S rRNA (adenine2030-N6)-methyltransferase
MNYRHAFHAGNFADVVKHAALLHLLGVMAGGRDPMRVIDTHAGGGAYDLGGAEAQKSREADEGVLRLLAAADAPAALAPLVKAVRELNPDGATRFYPGSPLLIAKSLRPADRYVACELRPDDHQNLLTVLKPYGNAEARRTDGYAAAADAPAHEGAELVLIDPPFERPDDYLQIVRTVRAVVRRNAQAVVMVWLPLKDLETFDGFVRDLEDAVTAPVLLAETRTRPLSDPMKMNGCVLALVGAPAGTQAALEAICTWVAAGFGSGGSARIWTAG